MNIETMIYLANVFPNVSCLITVSSVVILIITPIAFIITIDVNDFDEEGKKAKIFVHKYLIGNIKWVFVALFISMVIPSERTMYLMLGANFLKSSSLPSKVEMAIEKKIDSYLNEGEKK